VALVGLAPLLCLTATPPGYTHLRTHVSVKTLTSRSATQLFAFESTVGIEIIRGKPSHVLVSRARGNPQEKSSFSLTDERFSLILNLKSRKHG